MRRQIRLRPSIAEIVEIEILSVAIGMCAQDAEPIEMGTDGKVLGWDGELDWHTIKGGGDLAATFIRSVVQGPIVRSAIRQDVRAVAGITTLLGVEAIKRRKEKAFATRPTNVHAQKIRRNAN